MLVSGKNSSYKSHGKYRSPEVQLLSKLQLHEENVQDKQKHINFQSQVREATPSAHYAGKQW